jgi:hypothetical protein
MPAPYTYAVRSVEYISHLFGVTAGIALSDSEVRELLTAYPMSALSFAVKSLNKCPDFAQMDQDTILDHVHRTARNSVRRSEEKSQNFAMYDGREHEQFS